MNREERFMQVALSLAKKHLGLTASNPSVGCVIVKDGNIISSATTRVGGRPHAEGLALAKEEDFEGAEMFVTLEPCSHYGKTPPCVENIIKSKIKTVYIAVKDPDIRVSGNGIQILKNAGIEVILGVCQKDVLDFYLPYLFSKLNKRPFVTVKLAISIDGKISTKTGDSKWISSEKTRMYTNFLRHKYNGILIGAKTYKQDLPNLTCRVENLESFSPTRFICSKKIKSVKGFEILKGEEESMLTRMYDEFFINHLLIEGGASVISKFLSKNLVNEIMVVQSPIFIGNKGRDCVSFNSIDLISEAKRYKLKSSITIGDDVINLLQNPSMQNFNGY